MVHPLGVLPRFLDLVAIVVFADPIAAVFIGVLVLWSAGKVLRGSTSILLERSPLSPDELRADLTALDGVERVDGLHVWQVCSQLTVTTVRLRETVMPLDEQRAIRSRVHEVLSHRGKHRCPES